MPRFPLLCVAGATHFLIGFNFDNTTILFWGIYGSVFDGDNHNNVYLVGCWFDV